MRYFLFSYSASDDTRTATGNLYFSSSSFPGNDLLKAEAARQSGFPNIVILGWNEFKSKKDYDNFAGA